MPGMTLVRPQPRVFETTMPAGLTPGELLSAIVDANLDKPVIPLGAKRSSQACWAANGRSVNKQVFVGVDAGRIPSYLVRRREEFLAAFRGEGGKDVPNRWRIISRVLSDLSLALGPSPFESMPFVTIVPLFQAANNLSKAKTMAELFAQGKPEHLQTAFAATLGDDLSLMSRWDSAIYTICQLKDLFPLEVIEASQVSPEDMVSDMDPGDLFNLFLQTVRAYPVPTGALDQALTQALQDFIVPASGRVTAGQLVAQAAWMRKLKKSPVTYVPCKCCGFPTFYLSDGKRAIGASTETGWQAGSLLGGGWAPGTDTIKTIVVPVCPLCRAEKSLSEGGARRFGRRPFVIKNLGTTAIPAEALTRAYNTAWKGTPLDTPGEAEDGLQPGEEHKFGDLADGQLGEVKIVPSKVNLRNRLLYPYLMLKAEGYDVAFGEPMESHPCGIFGEIPAAARPKASPQAFKQALSTAAFRHGISVLPWVAPAPKGTKDGDAKHSARCLAAQRSALSVPTSHLPRLVVDALRCLLSENLPSDSPLFTQVTSLFSLEGAIPMSLASISLQEHAAAWAEALYPTFASKRDLYGKKAKHMCTKAMSEAIQAMTLTPKAHRLGAGVSALTRNLSQFLTKEDRANLPETMARMTTLLEAYAPLEQNDLVGLKNHLIPMVTASVLLGVTYVPGQNNYVSSLGRRILDEKK